MYSVNNAINIQEYNKLQVTNLARTENLEIISICLEKDAIFPEHVSPRDVQLIVLEGAIDFHINNEKYHLVKHQHFCFPKEISHWVKSKENSKFLIIR